MYDYITIGISVTILVVVIYICHNKTKKKINESFGLKCTNCNRNNWMGESDCMSCSNCGWCIDPNGYGSCGLGNANGPLFKDCRSWYYNGICMWGPECGSSGPVYYNNPIVEYPWYTRWWYMGRRPWRRVRRYRRHHRFHPRRQMRMIRRSSISGPRRRQIIRGGSGMRGGRMIMRTGGGMRGGGMVMRTGGGRMRSAGGGRRGGGGRRR